MRLSAAQAGYMELQNAVKDADCRKVEVKGGVSSQLGCCDLYQPESKAVKQFRCGECEYLKQSPESKRPDFRTFEQEMNHRFTKGKQ